MFQLTIKKPVTVKGIGLHTGKKCSITLLPAPPDTGIVFIRDLVEIKAIYSNAVMTPLCTTLHSCEKHVKTVEHLLAAVSASMIDNMIVVCDSDEIPIMDGSSMPFMILLQEAGVAQQSVYKKFMVVTRPAMVFDRERWAMVQPFNGIKYNVSIDFGHAAIDAHPNVEFEYTSPSSFMREVAGAKTFGFLNDLETLRAQNLIQGANVSNAIVLDQKGVVNPDAMRFKDEFVRHKLLDAVGDMRLLGMNFIGQFKGFKTGHQLNLALCRKIVTNGHYKVIDRPDIPLDTSPFLRASLSY